MEHFNFDDPADVYVGGGRVIGGGRATKKSPVTYRRFPTGAEAIRFAIEFQSPDKLIATVVEVDDIRLDASEIKSLYDSEAYPLPRRQLT